MKNLKPNNATAAKAVKPAEPAPKPVTAPPAPAKVAPLFRRMDWLALVITFVTLWGIYLFTLAPEVTLEDSGELCTGSYYAGIPHAPGYPFWVVYSWLWTVMVPFGNVAWRVGMGESFAAAMGCGLVALLVSRGSSMLIEGIAELKDVSKRWENAIGLVAGCVTGLLVGLDAYMWSESVVINRISLFGVPWLTVVLVLLLRWMYAPQQRKYLYWAMYVYGLCATIHQSLLLSAMGIEVVIAMASPRLGRDLFLTNSLIYIICVLAKKSVPALDHMSSLETLIFNAVGISSLVATGWLSLKVKGFLSEWRTILIMGGVWALGVCFYFFEPISGMTIPPMEWCYPRTVDGFLEALSRGQYEGVHGTDIFDHPVAFFIRFGGQLGYIVRGLADSFSWVYIFIGLIPFLFLPKMHARERAWIIGVSTIYFCLAVLMVIMLDVTPDRSATELNKVFFTASHTLFAILIGYGLTLTAAYAATHYQKFRRWGLVGGCVAVMLALYWLKDATGQLFFGPAGEVSLADLPHYIGQAFAKDQYGSPVYANLILLALPVILLLALLVYRTRGPIMILLGLFLVMPVWSGLTHWDKSEQRGHWYGYWYGHDMFTPPYGIYPEMTRNAILFGGTDPGRFNPTYMIFCESFIPHACQPAQDQKFDRRDVYIITQNALAQTSYQEYIRSQYFRSAQKDPPFFSELVKYAFAIPFGPGSENNPIVSGLAGAAYHLLDVPFTAFGASVEKRRRAEGVYPPKEIYTPSTEDSQACFQDYIADVQRRQAINQLKPGEDVQINNGRVQVSGQVAVMEINALISKVIFDRNPTNEFFVQESVPLDWMYPYELPYGIIMKINREPVPELTPDVLKKDHEFWSKYCERLIGNWITYDTSVKEIGDFAEKLYVHNNYEGFKGDRTFIRDNDAQAHFSGLRNTIAGIYAWRCTQSTCPQEYWQKTAASQNALVRETDFAFKQSFALCPYGPPVYRYVNFLLQQNRLDDALIVGQTCLKLDPFNDAIKGMVDQLEKFQKQNAAQVQSLGQLPQMEAMARTNPGNVANLLSLAAASLHAQNTVRATQLFDQALNNSNITADDVAGIAGVYSQMGNFPKLEGALQKLVALSPDVPEPRFDLARLEVALHNTDLALKNLEGAIAMSNARLKTNPAAHDLLAEARKDPNLDPLRNLPAFQKIVPPR